MGERTNYKIVHSANREQDINIYSHWDGFDSVEIFRNAIAKAMARYGDDSYFIRTLTNALQSDHDSSTGYGISIGEMIQHEESYDYKEINLITGTVTVGGETFTIEDFVSTALARI